MKFKELEDKNFYSNSYGSSAYISNYIHYAGTEQISIYVKSGYGANEKTTNVIISEHELSKWVEDFKNSGSINNSINKKQNKMEQEKKDSKIDTKFEGMRQLLFDSMKDVKNGQLNFEKAKSISLIGQTIINSVKVEIDLMKIKNQK